MTSPFIGNNNTILNVLSEGSGGTINISAPFHSYGAVDNMMEQYPPVAMTSDSSGGYTSSASGSSAGSPFNAFDNDSTTTWTSLVNYNATSGVYTGATTTVTNVGNLSGEWLQLNFPSAIILNALMFAPGSLTAYANNWRLCARNSVAETWQVIHSETNTVANNTGGPIFQPFGLNPAFNTPYSSYLLIFLNAGPPTNSSGRDRITLQEVKFLGYPSTRANTGTWKLRRSVNLWIADFDATFRQPIGSQQPTINTVVVRPSSVDFARSAQQCMFSDNRVPFLMNTRGGFTAVAYVRLNSSAGDASANNECIFDFAKDIINGFDASIVLRRNGTSNAFEFYMQDTSSATVIAQIIGGTIVPGQWTTVVVRYTSSTNILELIQNQGTPITTTPTATVNNRLLTSLYIGRSNNPLDTVTLDGSVGGLIVYDRALTDAEVTTVTNGIYSQNQNVPPSFPDTPNRNIRIVLLPILTNTIFNSSCGSIVWSKNRWIAGGTRNAGGLYNFAYSNDGIAWTPADSAEYTVPASVGFNFGIVYNTLANGSGTGGNAEVTIPAGKWMLFALRDYLNYLFSLLPAPANTIQIGFSLTQLGRFTATTTASPKIYYLGSYGTLAIGLGFALMYPVATPSYAQTITAPNLPPNIIFTQSSNAVNQLATNGSMWVAGGQGSNSLAYSMDGVSWTGIGTTYFSASCNGVAWGNGRWVAVGSSTNKIATSTDGITWTGLGNIIFSSIGNKVAWNGTRWVAVGQGTNTIAYSNDGITWTGLSNTIFFTSGQDVAWNGKLWVAVGQGTNNVATSTDGITWVGRGLQQNTNAIGQRVCWNGSYWLVTLGLSTTTTGINMFIISQDGINWTGYTGQSLSRGSLRVVTSRFS